MISPHPNDGSSIAQRRAGRDGLDWPPTNTARDIGRWEINMGILSFILFGLVIGFVARALMPGTQKMGIAMTIVLGVAGSFLGGFLVSLVSDYRVIDFHTTGAIGSVVGALILLLVGGGVFARRSEV